MAHIIGTAGDDLLLNIVGEADTIDGGDGNDTVSFEGAGGVGVNLGIGLAADFVNGDFNTLISIENVRGSAFADALIGNSLANVLEGGGGNDFLSGEGGIDTVSYEHALGGAVVDLGAGIATNDGNGGVDLLTTIENVSGSAFADALTGDAGANVLTGGAGDDALRGAGGADVFEYDFEFHAGGGGQVFSFTEFFADHGGTVVGGEVADGTKQGEFSSLYTQWLEMLVRDHGLGSAVLDLGQNAGINGTPVIADMTGEFGQRESFTWTSGSGKKTVTHERWYSDTWSSGGGGEDSVTSTDGLDTILDFTAGEDRLSFSGITREQFLAYFNADASQNVTGGAELDTVITIDGFAGWSLTLADFTGDLVSVADNTTFS